MTLKPGSGCLLAQFTLPFMPSEARLRLPCMPPEAQFRLPFMLSGQEIDLAYSTTPRACKGQLSKIIYTVR